MVACLRAFCHKFQIDHFGSSVCLFRAHKQTAVKAAYDVDWLSDQPVGDKSHVYGHMKGLFDNARLSMTRGEYEPTLDLATASCQRQLMWWRRLHWGIGV